MRIERWLHRLEERGWVNAQWGSSENNRRAKFYALTKVGHAQLDRETESWRSAMRLRFLPPLTLRRQSHESVAAVSNAVGLVPKDDVDHELTFHLEMRTREFVERGESPERARQLALERFGDVERSRLECVAIGERRGYQLARARYLSELRQDIAYGLRMLRRALGLTAVAVLTMALGVGANSTVFSVVHGVRVRSLPFPEADRLYRLRMIYPDGSAYSTFSAPDFMSVRADTRVFEDVQAYTGGGAVTMLGVGEPSEVRVASVSDGLLRLLDIPVVIGRRFSREEHQLGRNGVALLDHAFWQRAFGGDLAAIGRQVTIGGIGYTVVGVIARGVRLPADVPGTRVPSEADVYLPLEYGPPFSATAAAGRRSNYLAVLARASHRYHCAAD